MEQEKQSIKGVVYPPIGIAHIADNIADLVKHSIGDKTSVNVHCASQPNSHPHLGTITTLMTAFAIAKHIGDHYGLIPKVKFEEIDNSPAEKLIKNGIVYSKNLKQVQENSLAKNEVYMQSFYYLFDYLKTKTGIDYNIRPFSEYQKLSFVREQLIKILDKEDDFAPIFSPSEGRLHIRIQCPRCGVIDKSGITLKKEKQEDGSYVLRSTCFEHGEFKAILSKSSRDFIDTNTPITDVIQGALFIEEDARDKAVSVMVDGNDWSGVWSLNIFSRGLCKLGYDFLDTPLHFYAPLITDWSGAKFSKSIYLASDAYKYLPQELIDFSKFISSWGEKGLDTLWEEVSSWVLEPKKLFRDYSIDYFKLLLEGFR